MKKRNINFQLLFRRIGLIIVDAIAVLFACFFALATRFEFIVPSIPPEHWQALVRYAPFFVVSTLIIFAVFHIYSSMWEYAGLQEVYNVLWACLVSGIFEIGIVTVDRGLLPRSFYILSVMYLMALTCLSRFSYRFIRMKRQRRNFPWKTSKNVMMIGAGEGAMTLLLEIQTSRRMETEMKVRCLIDDDPSKQGRILRGVKVAGDRNSIIRNVVKYNIDQIVICIPSASGKQLRPILEICKETDCELKMMPALYQLLNGEVSASKLRPVNVHDLLGREEVRVDLDQIMGYVSGKVVMVTGGGGSIGSELCRQIASQHPKRLVIFDIYENNAYEIQQELKRNHPELTLSTLVGSVRDQNRLDAVFEKYRPEIVYHAAAHKHVPLMEKSPNEAIKNNVLGTYKLVQMADKWGVQKFVQISTDKAVNPTNIMGASKRMCEMIIQCANETSKTDFVAVRFGNVLGSNGSVIPLFKKQIAEGGPVTVTHPDIIRYFMTIPEAVSLVLQAGAYAKGGEIFVLDMGEPVRIMDLAKNMIRLSGLKLGKDIDIKITGLRPGEKLYEELLMDEEGMTETPNQQIFIGHPIDVNKSELYRTLKEMEIAAESEVDDMRMIVQSIVPTYHPVNEV